MGRDSHLLGCLCLFSLGLARLILGVNFNTSNLPDCLPSAEVFARSFVPWDSFDTSIGGDKRYLLVILSLAKLKASVYRSHKYTGYLSRMYIHTVVL
jgi:hypothetical protein